MDGNSVMHGWKKWACALALAGCSLWAQAAPTWQINTAGTGPAGATALASLDVAGVGFVQILPDANDPLAFTFIEHGAYRAVQADGTTPFGGNDLTIRYMVGGSGSFLDPSVIRFDSGNIELYSDPAFDFGTTAGNYGADNGTLVARLSVLGGGTAPGGLVTMEAAVIAGSLLPGYFFAADGTDFAALAKVVFSLGVFNQPTLPDALMVSEIICGMAGYAGPGCNGAEYVNTPLAFAVRDGGYVSVTAVPEPPTAGLAIAGLGLLAAGTWRRKAPTPLPRRTWAA